MIKMEITKNTYKIHTSNYYRGQRYYVVATLEGFMEGYIEVPLNISPEVYSKLECHGGVEGETRYINTVDVEAKEDYKFLKFSTGHENDLPHLMLLEECFSDNPSFEKVVNKASKQIREVLENYNEYREKGLSPRAISPSEVIANCCSLIDQLEQQGIL